MRLWRLVMMAVVAGSSVAGAGDLDGLIDGIDPDVPKWVTVVEVGGEPEAPPFTWHHYRDSETAIGFWPASTIKLYAAVRALERLNELEMPFDVALHFEHREDDVWVLDCARSVKEMLSEVFRRSSNEDYTLLLRFCGIDDINTKFLVPERGFPQSVLMRGYVLGRPYEYIRKEPQRITLIAQDGAKKVVEHEWSGHSYSKERGATVISETTGNCTSTAELAECMRRVMFHEAIPEAERYNLTDEQARFLREGGKGYSGMKSDSGYSWKNAVDKVFPNATYYRKTGMISRYHLDIAYFADPDTGVRFILSVATESDKADTLKSVAKTVATWLREKAVGATEEEGEEE